MLHGDDDDSACKFKEHIKIFEKMKRHFFRPYLKD